MTVGLLLLAVRPPDAAMVDHVRTAAGEPVDVTLAHLRPLGEKSEALAAAADSLHDLAQAAGGNGPAFRRSLRDAPPFERMRLHLAHDPVLRSTLTGPTVLVPLDQPAAKAIEALAADEDGLLVATPESLADAVRRAARRRTGPGVPSMREEAPGKGRLARTLRRLPGVGDRPRATTDRETALDLLRDGRLAQAEQFTREAAQRVSDARERADLLGDVTSLALHLGHPTDLFRETVAAELAAADELLDQTPREAAVAFAEAARTAFHPTLHLHHLTSPLAADPAGFVAPLAQSATARRLRHARSTTRGSLPVTQGRDSRRDPVGEGRPTRVLLLTRGNANFLGEIQRHLDEHPDFEVRSVDAASAASELNRYARDLAALAERMLVAPDDLADEVRQHLGGDMEWADVVFVEWCTVLAALVALAAPDDVRLVVRLHSYEAFTPWPQLVDFRAVDDLLLVSEHLRELSLDAIPALREEGAPALGVLPLGMELHRFRRPKTDGARHTLALVGWSKVVKDPLWALDVLRALRSHDERYRLLLVGADFDPTVSVATEAYGVRLQEALTELEAQGAVQRYGSTDDVPEALRQVGVILSTSVRESFHAGLVEGAASGAVPVVRDWPYFAGRDHGAGTLFPPDWVVATPHDAADRILALTRDDDTWRAAGAQASDHVVTHWDWQVVQEGYARFLRG